MARAAATGGGRTHRTQQPSSWYLALILIVVLGLISVFWARYEYRKGPAAAIPPAVGTTWYAGFGFNLCGTSLSSPAANVNASQLGLYTTGNGLMTIAPKTNAQAGVNANLGRFVGGYVGMKLTETTLKYPGSPAYTNGEACPAGTKDAGQKGYVAVRWWSGPEASLNQGVTVSGDPGKLLMRNSMLVTMAFVPKGTAVPKPSASVIEALLSEVASGGVTTTTAAGGATTTTAAGGVTTTTAPASTTTSSAATTTTTK